MARGRRENTTPRRLLSPYFRAAWNPKIADMMAYAGNNMLNENAVKG
jgi:hypothetical protein